MKIEIKKQSENIDNNTEKMSLSDAMKSIFVKAIKESYNEGIVDGMIHKGDEKIVIDKILQKYC